MLLGPGDDAAVVAAQDGRVVVSTDLLVEGRHFRLDWSTAYDIGRKAAAQNLADIAAMGARPTALVVGLGMPADTALSWVDGLTEGLRDECALVGASVAGGDLASADFVVLGVTALGSLDGAAPVTRAGARPGQVVAVAGHLGYSAAGLALLLATDSGSEQAAARGSERSGRPLAEGSPWASSSARVSTALEEVVSAHRRPRPPYACGPEAARLGASAMMDVSDGLLQDLGHIAGASGVRIVLDPRAFAVDEPVALAAKEVGADPMDWVLAGGEDHALVAVFPEGVRLPPHWTVVGRVETGEGVTVTERDIRVGGWDHFRG
ncbi:thiamine-phosphate kinase [Nonomuraea longicatena]|uniref:Thiamine-monophosphate kinase n=1 Tax=Nonomuraea longicatena TaxID=83682 RepID=A0ABN1P417_9ACTN